MHRLGGLGVFVCLVSACAPIGGQGKAAKSDKGDKGNVLVLSPSLMAEGQKTAPAWLVYGITKISMLEKPKTGTRQSVTDFDSELEARRMMTVTWKDFRREKGKPDKYLDLLTEIADAGFLPEYVIMALARPGWTIPGKDMAALRFGEYATWAETHVPDHQVLTLAEAQSDKTPQHPRVPGASLPPPASLSPQKIPCQQSATLLAQAQAAWREESRSLKPMPLSAADRSQFVALLMWVLKRPASQYADGVVWVSDKAHALNYYAGFCQVEMKDPAAIASLRTAAALTPASPVPRLELAQALLNAKQVQAANDEVDAVMELPLGKCTQGMAWRKRGFILYEQGKLKEAFEAYRRSLDFDPNNKIAFTELRSLAGELQRTGKLSSKEKASYTPPPVLPGQTTTTCKEGD
jgi:hypothetical protein